MRKPSVAVIINPAAGRMGPGAIDSLYAFYSKNSVIREFDLTEKAGDAEAFTESVARKGSAELLVVVGGDGTLNEVVNGLLPGGPPIGYIPGGTTNVIRYELKLPEELEAAARITLRGRPMKIHPGLANGRRFLLMTGVGIDGEIVKSVSYGWKKILGKGEYIRVGIEKIFTYPRVDLRVSMGGQEVPGEFPWVLIARSSHYGGKWKIVREASLDKVALKGYLFKKGGVINFFLYGLKSLLGFEFSESEVEKIEGLEIRIDSNLSVPYQVDGDFAGTLPLHVGVDENYVEIMVP
jgi:YegS/Rv2252/BmrU family lipid kinase